MCDYHDSCYSRLYKSACEIEEDQEIQGLEQLHQVLNLVSQAKEKKNQIRHFSPFSLYSKSPYSFHLNIDDYQGTTFILA